MKFKSLAQILAAILLLAIVPSLQAAEMVVGNVRVIKVTGSSAQLISAVGKTTSLQEGMFIQQGSKILTGGDSSVSLVFENGSSVEVESSSSFSIDEFVQDPFSSENLDYKNVDKAPTRSVTQISVPKGSIIFNVAKQQSGSTYNIVTPVGVAGIRGTAGFAGSRGFGLTTGSASFTRPGGSSTNIGAGQSFNSGTGLSNLPQALQQMVNSATQSMNSNTPSQTFAGAPPNISRQQYSAIINAYARGGSESLAQTASQLAATDPNSAADIAAVAAFFAPAEAPQIAAAVAQTVPAAAADIAQNVSKVAPPQSQNVVQAILAAVPTANPEAVQQAAQQGAQQSSGQQQQNQGQGNQPLSTGDQGTTTAGQQLPGTGSGGGASGNPAPRPTPASQ